MESGKGFCLRGPSKVGATVSPSSILCPGASEMRAFSIYKPAVDTGIIDRERRKTEVAS